MAVRNVDDDVDRPPASMGKVAGVGKRRSKLNLQQKTFVRDDAWVGLGKSGLSDRPKKRASEKRVRLGASDIREPGTLTT